MTVSVIRTVILYAVLVLAMRIMGKRQLGELQPSELVVTLLLSDLAAVPMQENGLPLTNGLLPILVLVALELLLSGAMLKFPWVARLVAGTPMTVIRDGRLQEPVMRKLRISVEDLTEALRQQEVFDIRQVQYAVAETNGHISVYCYPRFQPATAEDVGRSPADEGMPVVVISDGRLCAWGLALCGLDEAWVERILEDHRCSREAVFLLTASKSGKHYLLKRDEVKEAGR